MHHFKYNIIKKEILAKRQDYFKELTEQKLNLDQFTNKSLNEVALMQKLKEANEILDELMVDNWSEYNKQESQEWIDIQIASDTNRTLYNSLLFKRKHNKNNIDTINERIIKLGKLVEFGDWLYGKLDKMEDALSIVELKKDYRPILESNTINKIVTSRGAIIVKCINSCFTNGMLHPNRFKNVSTHFEYLENDHELCFQNEVKVKVDNDFFKKIEFICDYLDFNDIEKNKELDDCYFPISYEIPNNFDTRTDVGLNGDSFDFHLSIINHEIHESYSGDILNCTFRLRLLIDFILSYKI